MKIHCVKILMLGLFFVLLSAFENPNNRPLNEDEVVVHIYRPKRAVGFAWIFNLKVNGRRYDKIKNGDHLVLHFKPGETTFAIKKKVVTLDLESGKTYYLRTFIAAGVYIGSLDIVEVTESFAKTELERIHKRRS
nr:DUF2846 domain-containing protein [uncultured Allomuricauda sp.]